MTMVERVKPVHFEGRKTTPCGRDMRMGANIFATNQLGNVTCRKCLSKMKAKAVRQDRMISAALGEP